MYMNIHIKGNQGKRSKRVTKRMHCIYNLYSYHAADNFDLHSYYVCEQAKTCFLGSSSSSSSQNLKKKIKVKTEIVLIQSLKTGKEKDERGRVFVWFFPPKINSCKFKIIC